MRLVGSEKSVYGWLPPTYGHKFSLPDLLARKGESHITKGNAGLG